MNMVNYLFNDDFIYAMQVKEKILFKAKDVCKILGIMNVSQAMQRLDEDERYMFNIGRQGKAYFVNESGLYVLILNSRKPEAREFRKWITNEVIPSIRKHGAYATENTIDKIISDPDFAIRLLEELKQEQAQSKLLRKKAIENAPKVLLANAITSSDDCILIRDLAVILNQNGIDIGQNRLYEVLRSNGYLIKGGSSKNLPTQRSMDLKVMKIKERLYNVDKLSITSVITTKGQEYFINKFLSGALK